MKPAHRVVSTLLVCLFPVAASAQFIPPSVEIAAFPLNALPVSARCMSMGNACTAIANDLDMLTANPAGAANIKDTTLSVQGRYAILETVYLDQDAVDSEYLGGRSGQLYKPLKDEPIDIAFAGISKPFGRWTVSAFYQKTLSFDGSPDVEDVVDAPNDRLFTNRNAFSASLESLGVSAALNISDAWSVGLSIIAAEMRIENEDSWQIRSLSGEPVLQTDYDSVLQGNLIRSDDSNTLLEFGLIWHPGRKFSAGFTYRQGGKFNFSSHSVQLFSREGDITDNSTPASTNVSLPDSLSVGIGWRATESVLFSFDIERLSHSDLPPVRDHSLGLNLSVENLTEPIKDTSSFKLGFEKQFSGHGKSSNRYALRLGIMTESDHDGLSIVDGYDTLFSGGFGAAFGQWQQFVIDAGIWGGDEEILFIASFKYVFVTSDFSKGEVN